MRIYAWQGLLDRGGPFNVLLGPFGFRDTDFLSGLPITVILGLVYGYIPFMILPIYASLDRIPESLLEAGRDLGASGRQTFWRVTLPMSSPRSSPASSSSPCRCSATTTPTICWERRGRRCSGT